MNKYRKIAFLIMLVIIANVAVTKTSALNKENRYIYEGSTICNGFVINKYKKMDYTSVMTTTKFKGFEYRVSRDGVLCFIFNQEVNFVYGIPTSNGDYAQITNYSAKVTYTNSSSAYYPDTSELTNSLVKFGNPAKLTSKIPIRKKSNNKKVDTPSLISKFYGSGRTE